MNPNRFTQRERVVYRGLEMVSGVLTWLTFVVAIGLSFWRPVWAITFILIFDLYWLIRLVIFLIFMSSAWARYRRESVKPWNEMLKRDFSGRYEEVFHVVLLPFWKEPYEVLLDTLLGHKNSHYNLKRILIVLPGEKRNEEHCKNIQEKLVPEFREVFYDVLSTMHELVPGELAGKAANLTSTAKKVKEYLDERSIPYENVLVSSFDSDTVPHPEYFACLTYHFLSQENPTRASYQPLVVYSNNMWESAWFTRVVSNSTTFWLLSEFGRGGDRLISYSSHAIPFKVLVDVDFWETDMVSDDSRIFLQAYLRYSGNYKLVPLSVPVYLDTVDTGSFWRTIKNQYLQVRRWGYGVEHVPYLFYHFFKQKEIPWRKKWKHLFYYIEGYYFWATVPIMMILLGRLPLVVMSYRSDATIVLQRTPQLLELLMQVGMVGVLISAIVNITFIPAKPARFSRFRYLAMVLQWVFLPISMIIFGSIPVADAQTRMMLGKYLGFWNTEKIRRA